MRETAGEFSRSIKDYSEETRNLFAIKNGSYSRFRSPEAIEGRGFGLISSVMLAGPVMILGWEIPPSILLCFEDIVSEMCHEHIVSRMLAS